MNLLKWITLDVMKLQRPERSGVIAVFVAYSILWAWGYALVPHDFSEEGKFSLLCWVAPWECPKAPEPRMTREEIEKYYHIVLLSPTGKGKKCCTCHIDLHYFGKPPIIHLYSQYEPTCDSFYTVPRKWTTITTLCQAGSSSGGVVITSCGLTFVGGSGQQPFFIKNNEAEYRYHCE